MGKENNAMGSLHAEGHKYSAQVNKLGYNMLEEKLLLGTLMGMLKLMFESFW